MNTNKDGGHAFPTTFVEPNIGGTYSGMSLRDYFAAAALHEVMREWEQHRNTGDGTFHEEVDLMAQDAYTIADAMLAERAKQGGGK